MAYDLTVILTAHREGPLVYTSLLSVKLALKHLYDLGLKVEIILTLDNGDTRTQDVIQNWQLQETPKIDQLLILKLGDLGLSRNAAINVSQGEILCFLDCDDLYGETWLLNAYKYVKEHPCAIAHPEVNIYFEKSLYWWRHLDQNSEFFKASHLIYHNYWTALSMARRSVYCMHPYSSCEKGLGFSYEDWHWNCEVFEAGYEHKVVPETCHFIRQKMLDGMVQSNNSLGALVKPSKLFSDISKLQFCLNDEVQPFRNDNILINLFKRICRKFKHLIEKKSSELPMFALRQLEKISLIEPQLKPTTNLKFILNFRDYYPLPPSLTVDTYKHLLKKVVLMENLEKIVFLTSTDLFEEWSNVIDSLGLNTLIINTGSNQIKHTRVIHLQTLEPYMARELSYAACRIALQFKPSEIHIIGNSHLPWDCLNRYGARFKGGSKIYAYLPNRIDSEGDGLFSNIRTYYKFIDSIIRDESKESTHYQSLLGIECEKINAEK